MGKVDIMEQLEMAEKHLDNVIMLEGADWVGAMFRGHIRKALTEIALAKEGMPSVGCSSHVESSEGDGWVIKIGQKYVDGVQFNPECYVCLTENLKNAWRCATKQKAEDTIRSLWSPQLRKGMSVMKVMCVECDERAQKHRRRTRARANRKTSLGRSDYVGPRLRCKRSRDAFWLCR